MRKDPVRVSTDSVSVPMRLCSFYCEKGPSVCRLATVTHVTYALSHFCFPSIFMLCISCTFPHSPCSLLLRSLLSPLCGLLLGTCLPLLVEGEYCPREREQQSGLWPAELSDDESSDSGTGAAFSQVVKESMRLFSVL